MVHVPTFGWIFMANVGQFFYQSWMIPVVLFSIFSSIWAGTPLRFRHLKQFRQFDQPLKLNR